MLQKPSDKLIRIVKIQVGPSRVEEGTYEIAGDEIQSGFGYGDLQSRL